MTTVDAALAEKLRGFEEELWRVDTRFNRERMNELFAEEFCEIGRSGRVWCRDELLNIAHVQFQADLPLPEFSIRALSNDVVQVTYVSVVQFDSKLERAQRSSIWINEDGAWRIVFHQGTANVVNL